LVSIEITMRHGNLSNEIEAMIKEKVARLEKLLLGAPRIEVIVDRAHERYRCEMIVHATSRDALKIAHDEHEDLRATVDQVVDKMGRQLIKLRERRRDHHRGDGKRPGPGPAPADDEEPTYEQIVKDKSDDRRGK